MAVRPISDAEAAVIERTLEIAAVSEDAGLLRVQVRSLQVVNRCPCGCATVEFKHLVEGQAGRMVADASGESADGEILGVIVWAFGNDLTELEIYNYSENPAPLPTLASIRKWHGIDITAA